MSGRKAQAIDPPMTDNPATPEAQGRCDAVVAGGAECQLPEGHAGLHKPIAEAQGQLEQCETCGEPITKSAEEANCLNFEVHGQPERCPECGAVGMLWHKLGCSRDPDAKGTTPTDVELTPADPTEPTSELDHEAQLVEQGAAEITIQFCPCGEFWNSDQVTTHADHDPPNVTIPVAYVRKAVCDELHDLIQRHEGSVIGATETTAQERDANRTLWRRAREIANG